MQGYIRSLALQFADNVSPPSRLPCFVRPLMIDQ
jgi:hypothetical protein